MLSRIPNGYKLPRIQNYEHLFDITLAERHSRNIDNVIRLVKRVAFAEAHKGLKINSWERYGVQMPSVIDWLKQFICFCIWMCRSFWQLECL